MKTGRLTSNLSFYITEMFFKRGCEQPPALVLRNQRHSRPVLSVSQNRNDCCNLARGFSKPPLNFNEVVSNLCFGFEKPRALTPVISVSQNRNDCCNLARGFSKPPLNLNKVVSNLCFGFEKPRALTPVISVSQNRNDCYNPCERFLKTSTQS